MHWLARINIHTHKNGACVYVLTSFMHNRTCLEITDSRRWISRLHHEIQADAEALPCKSCIVNPTSDLRPDMNTHSAFIYWPYLSYTIVWKRKIWYEALSGAWIVCLKIENTHRTPIALHPNGALLNWYLMIWWRPSECSEITVIFKKPVWDDLSFVTWCFIPLK